MFYGLRRRIGPHKEILRALWQNRDSLPRAWRILNEGVCDGCALGTRGLRDWTIDGIHICWIRLNLLRLNTMGPLDAARLPAIPELEGRSEAELRALGRLGTPLLRITGEDRFRVIGWDQALEIAAGALAAPPERLGFYQVSRGTLNESYYACQKALRALGCTSIDNSARICHSPSTVALKESTGFSAGTCSYRDLYHSELLMLFGSDIANNQPLMMKYIHEAKKHGLKVVVVNPYREPGLERYWVPSSVDSALLGTRVADLQVPVRVGGDLALVHALLKELITREALDAEFIREHTSGWPALQAELENLSWPDLCASSGLSRQQITELADLYARARSAIIVWSMGITMHARGTDTVQALVNLALARGNIGRPGCGVMPIRGHSGVQGGAEMGCLPGGLPGGRPLTAAAAAELEALWGFPVSTRAGLDISSMLEAGARGDLETIWCVGGNLAAVMPDPAAVRHALGRIPVRVHHDIVLSPQALLPAGEQVLVLPATTRYEVRGGGTETTSERRVVYSSPIPGSRVDLARDDWSVLRDAVIRNRPELAAAFDWQDTAAIRREIARVIPAYGELEGLERGGQSFQLGGVRLGQGGHFGTPDGRARFVYTPMVTPPAEDGLFALSTRRGKQFNSMVFGERDMLGEQLRDSVVLCPQDLERLGLTSGDRVRVSSDTGELVGRARPGGLHPGTVMLCWPEANVLVPLRPGDSRSGMPGYRDVRVRIEALPG